MLHQFLGCFFVKWLDFSILDRLSDIPGIGGLVSLFNPKPLSRYLSSATPKMKLTMALWVTWFILRYPSFYLVSVQFAWAGQQLLVIEASLLVSSLSADNS